LNKLILHIAYFFLPLFTIAQQNFVFNGDFEQYSSCPTNATDPSQIPYEIEKCIGWKSPTYATSDFFNTCSSNPINQIPFNSGGVQNTFNGNGYLGFASVYQVGMGTDGYNGPMWWEYVQGQFTQALEEGIVYKFSMEVSLAEYSDLMISELGVYFSDLPISSPNTAALKSNPQIIFYEPNYFQDTIDWIHLESYYVANGTEKFLTIGNYRDNIENDTLRRYNLEPNSANPYVTYFYIDAVSLTDASNDIEIANVFTPNGDGANDIWKLPFASGKNEKQVYIVNRWGNLITQGSLNGFYWDGNDACGNAVSDGVYFYKVSGTNISGFIQLIH
jgi:gliding motility-associated-like protein